MNSSEAEKPHFVYDFLNPALLLCALSILASFVVQIWTENENALAAKANGPVEMSCAEVLSRDDLTSEFLKITQVRRGKNISVQQNEGAFSFACLLYDKQRNDKSKFIVFQGNGFDSQNDCLRAAQTTPSVGVLRSSDSVWFKHKTALANACPAAKIDQAYVLVPIDGDPLTTNYAVVFIVVTIAGVFVCVFWIIRGLWRAFRRRGYRFKFEKTTLLPQSQVANTELIHRVEMPLKPVDPAKSTSVFDVDKTQFGSATDFDQIPRPKYWLLTRLLATSSLICFAAVMVLWLIPGMSTLWAVSFFLCLVSVSLFFFSMTAGSMNLANHCCIEVSELTLPAVCRQYFATVDTTLSSLNFEHHRTFVGNLFTKLVVREYFSSDGTIYLQVSKMGRLFSGIQFFSVLANGQVFMTSDREVVESAQPLLGITTGVKGNLRRTFDLHRQIVEQFDDLSLRINADELPSLHEYTETLELQAIGLLPVYDVPLPKFRDLMDKAESVRREPALTGHWG